MGSARSGLTSAIERAVEQTIERGLLEFKTMEPQPEPQGFMDFRSLRPAGQPLRPWLRTPTPAQITRVEATRNRTEPPPPPEPVRAWGIDFAERADMFTIDSWPHTIGWGDTGVRRSARLPDLDVSFVPLEMSTRDIEERISRYTTQQRRAVIPLVFHDYEGSILQPRLSADDRAAQERHRESIRTFAQRYGMGQGRLRDLQRHRSIPVNAVSDRWGSVGDARERHRDVNDPSTHDIQRERLPSVYGTVTGRTSSGGPDMQTIRRAPNSPLQGMASTLADLAAQGGLLGAEAMSAFGRAIGGLGAAFDEFSFMPTGDDRFDQLRAIAAQAEQERVQPVAYAVPIIMSGRRPINLEPTDDERQRAEFLARNARNEAERAALAGPGVVGDECAPERPPRREWRPRIV